MPASIPKDKRQSYGFYISEKVSMLPVQLRSVGWEQRTSPDYDWDNRQRHGDAGCLLFQYTLSGEGRIRFGEEEEHALRAGDAFLITLPGDHRYYFPHERAGTDWEFIYMMISGREAVWHAEQLMQEWGQVVRLKRKSAVIRQLQHIYREAAADRIRDGFTGSALAYAFLMECFRMTKTDAGADGEQDALSIQKAITWIEAHYAQPIELEELAAAAGLSKYYFTRQFRDATGMTPIQYVNRFRVDRAIELLNRTELTVEQVGRAVGYANGNYFCKVFRKTVGTSPDRFRRGRHTLSVDELRFH